MKIKNWIIVLLVMLCPFVLLADKSTVVSINGYIQGSHFDTVYLMISHFDALLERFQRSSTITDSVGRFTFLVTSTGAGDRLTQLSIKKGDEIKIILNDQFIVEQGDIICMNIKEENHSFSFKFCGKHSAKYTCSEKINKIMDAYDDELKTCFTHGQNQKLYYTISRFNNKILQVLSSYRSRINKSTFELIKADSQGYLFANRYLLQSFYVAGFSGSLNWKNAYVFFKSMHLDDKSFSKNTIEMSRIFRTYLMRRSQYKLLFFQHKKQITYKDIYTQEKKDYCGGIRDLLLIGILKIIDNNLEPGYNRDSAKLLWKEAIPFIATPALKAYAEKRSDYRSKGTPIFFNFTFEDSSARTVDMSAYRGKVMLIDVWFTGCGSCIKYNQLLKADVYPVFKNDTDIVFISICADKERNQWMKSLIGGKYTSTQNADFYTGGVGFEHPFLKYYEFDRGGVTLLVGKDGKIFNGDPPAGNAQALVKEIRNALGEKSAE